MRDNEYKDMIENRIKYAANSYSLTLMYQIYGTLEGLRMARVIDQIYYAETSCRICKEYFNNAAWRKECYRRSEL